jgi:drug/metabolite transporter (DMT)-like permease
MTTRALALAPAPLPWISDEGLGRVAVIVAVCLMAAGKVLYGSMLTGVSSPLFVFASFSITGVLFLSATRTMPRRDLGLMLALNAATAAAFMLFFFALKQIEPAIVGALEIAVGPIAALAVMAARGQGLPSSRQLVVCGGVVAGCGLLTAAALTGAGIARDASSFLTLAAVVASVLSGVSSTAVALISKALQARGWTSGEILAHRCYIVVLASGMIALADDGGAEAAFDASSAFLIVAIALIGVTAPLFLLQAGLRRCDPFDVMVTMAALPVVTFVLEGFTDAYAWSWLTALGTCCVALFVVADMVQPARAAQPGGKLSGAGPDRSWPRAPDLPESAGVALAPRT